jgi:transposase-like protein
MNESAAEGASSLKTNGAHAVPGKKRLFTEEFKRAAVQRVKKGEAVSAVSEGADIHASILRRWVKQGGPSGVKAAKAKGVSVGPSGRKSYSEPFQRAAVARLKKGEGAQVIAEDLKIHNSMLYGWRDKFAGKKATKGPVERHTDEFKRAAVKRVRAGETAEAVSRDLDVSSSGLHYWLNSKKFKSAKPNGLGVPLAKGAALPRYVAASTAVRDAITYLKHVKTDMYALLQSGAIKEFEEYHLNTLAALRRLQSTSI